VLPAWSTQLALVATPAAVRPTSERDTGCAAACRFRPGTLLLGRRRATSLGTVQESSAQPSGAGLSGLGTRVEQILRQAEQQATDHEQRSRQAADEIIATARAEAQSIIDQARARAAAITGPPEDAAP
jgi:ElaB/YqjD/DUF883 family membrane-anchored ribosome-binding protein